MSDTGKTLAAAGELAFIDRIRKMMPDDSGFFARSVGDDCLVTTPLSNERLLATTDTFVDTVHFSRDIMTFRETGRRCMTASVSDIAAMAGVPLFSLVSLSMPKELMLDDAVELFGGMAETADRYGCPVAGGETTSTPGPITITITVLGKATAAGALLRSGARPGDSVYVTGSIGDAMAGLEVLLKGGAGFTSLKRKFIAPAAHVSDALALAEKYRITAMIDVSDGIATDIGHICEESGCGVKLYSDTFPLSPEFREFAEQYDRDPVMSALSSGEEFELLFTSNDPSMPDKFTVGECTVTKIGMITHANDGRILIKENGRPVTLTARGYEHFKD